MVRGNRHTGEPLASASANVLAIDEEQAPLSPSRRPLAGSGELEMDKQQTWSLDKKQALPVSLHPGRAS